MLKSEQETVFRWAADEDHVSVWTAQAPVKRKLERAGYRPSKVSVQHGTEVGWFYRVPLAEFRWGARARTRRILSDAHRAALLRGASARVPLSQRKGNVPSAERDGS